MSISAFCLGASMLIFLVNFVMSTLFWRERETRNPWRSRGLEWQVSSPPPPDNFACVPVVVAGPYEYGDPKALPVADLNPPAGVISGEEAFYHEAALNAAWTGSRLAIGGLSFLSGAFAFAYFTCGRQTRTLSGSRRAASRRTCGPAPRS